MAGNGVPQPHKRRMLRMHAEKDGIRYGAWRIIDRELLDPRVIPLEDLRDVFLATAQELTLAQVQKLNPRVQLTDLVWTVEVLEEPWRTSPWQQSPLSITGPRTGT